MREIKFRAWEKYKKKMTKPSFIVSNGIPAYACTQESEYSYKAGRYIDALILIQYTGLTDKNGVEIYEGDIYHQGDINIKYKVIFKDGQFVGNQLTNPSLAGLSYWSARIEVIGNIHENPELLK